MSQSASSGSRNVFTLSPRIEVVPILHGHGDMAQAVRDHLLERRAECLAVPLPPSFEDAVLRGVDRLPQVTVAVAAESDSADEQFVVNYVPIDPCQPVIMGIRSALSEGMQVAWIDREVRQFEASPTVWPDAYALKSVSLGAYAAALLPFLPKPVPESQQWRRIAWMAFQLHVLELEYASILCLCPLQDWPWLRLAYHERAAYQGPEDPVERPSLYRVSPSSLYFVLSELPFVTELSERCRRDARSDSRIAIDGIKELLLEARTRWQAMRTESGGDDGRWLTPQLLQRYLQYVRNLTIVERRLMPDLYTLVLAARQMVGDDFAITLIETAKQYRFQEEHDETIELPAVSVGIGEMALPNGIVAKAIDRLAGPTRHWRSLSLRPVPSKPRQRTWAYRWNPFRQCSWPPEDVRVETFTAHVRDHARRLLGGDLPRIEKFTTSLRDGIDCRETLRHRMISMEHTPTIYVREMPPACGTVDVVVFLFDVPADPAKYSWHATWYAEHDQESTLCFFATPFLDNMVGPGIGQSSYGGAMFVFPPRVFPDIWEDPQFDWTQTLEERLIAAACAYAQERHIVLVTPTRPRGAWRRIARRYGRALIPISLGYFSRHTIDRLRRFHVLNGHEIRSYAAQFIR
ncbi:MAG: hypothetical protein D6690_15570 [Nitrospirae bacterium]|nr:MAG: hypothetical protein D6690_15570 [Nitrospirota bacterium]